MIKGVNRNNKSSLDSKKSPSRSTTMVITKKKPPNPPRSDSAATFTPHFIRERSSFRVEELAAAHTQPQGTKNKRRVNF